MKKIAENTVRVGVDVENVVDLFNLASSFEATTLKDFCFQFMRKNFGKVAASSNFKFLEFEVAKQLYIEFDPSNIKIFEQRRKIEELNNATQQTTNSPSYRQSHRKNKKTEKPKEESPKKKEDAHSGECNVCKKKCSSSCARCKKVFYCGSEHQKQDWKSHKLNCNKT